MNINELIIKEEKDLTLEQQKFITIHNNILNAGAMITNSIISLSKNLKVMRDEKLYLEADCKTFEEYAEVICGLKRSQAYSYIQVLERLGEDFVQSTGQIGITKLTMLSSLPEKEKEQIIETTNLEEISVKELKDKIDLLQKANDKYLENIELKDEEIQRKKEKINILNKQIVELEKKSKEIVQSTGQTKNSDYEDKIKKLKEELKINKEQLEASKEQLKINAETIGKLKKEKDLNSNTQLIEFKMLFDEVQTKILKLKELINNLPEDKKEGCKQALKKVGELC